MHKKPSYIVYNKDGTINNWKSYNTKLSISDARKFYKWIAEISKVKGKNILETDGNVYDFPIFWLKFIKNKQTKLMTKEEHFDDIGKKPNHLTFSTQSIWHNALDFNNIKLKGGKWKKIKNKWIFMPSQQQIVDGQKVIELYNLFKTVEKNSILVFPKSKTKIEFPKFEYDKLLKRLDNGKSIITHRIEYYYGKYNLGGIYYNKILGNLLVIKTCYFANITQSPYYKDFKNWSKEQQIQHLINLKPVQYIELIRV